MTANHSTEIDLLRYEKRLWSEGMSAVAGVDEAGRGCLAGPVVAAAVILKPWVDIETAFDSKQLTAQRREEALKEILDKSLSHSVFAACVATIDRIGILAATMQAMQGAVNRLKITPDFVLIDGNKCPEGLTVPAESIIQGDGLSRSIAAASILAKVTRDRLMVKLGKLYPQYRFQENKGYGTRSHLEALDRGGVCRHHRFSFRPVYQTRLKFGDE